MTPEQAAYLVQLLEALLNKLDSIETVLMRR
jgi:hypothetical protein